MWADAIRHIRLCYYLMPMCNAYLFIHSLSDAPTLSGVRSPLSRRTLDEIVSDEMRWARTNQQKLQNAFSNCLHYYRANSKTPHHTTPLQTDFASHFSAYLPRFHAHFPWRLALNGPKNARNVCYALPACTLNKSISSVLLKRVR